MCLLHPHPFFRSLRSLSPLDPAHVDATVQQRLQTHGLALTGLGGAGHGAVKFKKNATRRPDLAVDDVADLSLGRSLYAPLCAHACGVATSLFLSLSLSLSRCIVVL